MKLDNKLQKYIDSLINRYPQLKSVENDIIEGYLILEQCFEKNNKLLVAGNGGSAADSEHIVGELMKSFTKERKLNKDIKEKLISINEEYGTVLANTLQMGLPTIALDSHSSLITAYINDCNPLLCFAQQVNGYGNQNDAFLAISTSGNSENIIYAVITAKAKGLKIVGLTGKKESKLSHYADVCIKVPETETYMAQELHLPIYHCWCLMLEDHFFGE